MPNKIYYSYFKRYSPFSIGGVIRGIERKTARQLITRFKGKVQTEKYYNQIGERKIVLNNRNSILIYVGSE